MSTELPEIDEADVMLAQAAKGDFALMRHVQALALAATDAQEVGTLVHAYARVSRAMRQNLALLARQKADRAKAAREAGQHEAQATARPRLKTPEEMACQTRAEEVQAAVDRVISEASGGDHRRHTDWAHRFDREMDDWCEAPDFLIEDLDDQVRRACRTLGLPDDLAARWRELPEPTFFPEPEDVAATDDVSRPDAPARFAAPGAGRPFEHDPDDQGDAVAPALPWADSG